MEEPTEPIELESPDVNPFSNWSDWFDEEGRVLVTFSTIKHELYESWSRQCIDIEGGEFVENDDGSMTYNGDDAERKVEPEKLDASELPEPGVRRDGQYEDPDSVTETYTVIVPYPFLTPKICRKYLHELNKEYGRDLSLKIKDEQIEKAQVLADSGIKPYG